MNLIKKFLVKQCDYEINHANKMIEHFKHKIEELKLQKKELTKIDRLRK